MTDGPRAPSFTGRGRWAEDRRNASVDVLWARSRRAAKTEWRGRFLPGQCPAHSDEATGGRQQCRPLLRCRRLSRLLGQDDLRPRAILFHLRRERVERVEFRFGPQILDQGDLDRLAIEIFGKIEDIN